MSSDRPSRSLYDLAVEADRVQGACNLIAVARSFGEAMRDLSRATDLGTDDLRAHPIAVAWADKIASLTGIQSIGADAAMAAHREVGRIIAAGRPTGRGTDETAHFRAGD